MEEDRQFCSNGHGSARSQRRMYRSRRWCLLPALMMSDRAVSLAQVAEAQAPVARNRSMQLVFPCGEEQAMNWTGDIQDLPINLPAAQSLSPFTLVRSATSLMHLSPSRLLTPPLLPLSMLLASLVIRGTADVRPHANNYTTDIPASIAS